LAGWISAPTKSLMRALHVVLSGEEVSKTAYPGGLRVSEVTHLRVSDVDGQRMQ